MSCAYRLLHLLQNLRLSAVLDSSGVSILASLLDSMESIRHSQPVCIYPSLLSLIFSRCEEQHEYGHAYDHTYTQTRYEITFNTSLDDLSTTFPTTDASELESFNETTNWNTIATDSNRISDHDHTISELANNPTQPDNTIDPKLLSSGGDHCSALQQLDVADLSIQRNTRFPTGHFAKQGIKRSTNADGRYECVVCGRTYDIQSCLRRHERKKHEEPKKDNQSLSTLL